VVGHRVDVHAGVAVAHFLFVDAHHDTRGVDLVDHAAAAGGHGHTGVARHGAFDAGAHEWLFAAQGRHGLTLHVGAHQGAVGIVMLQEWHQGRRHRHGLHRRHVHVVHFGRRTQLGFAAEATGHEVLEELAVLV